MKAVILAAGAGRRLGLSYPKCLVEVAGRSILRHQLDAFRAVGVSAFTLVVGYEQHQIRDHLADQVGTFHVIHNPRWAETNTIYSLYLARDHLAGPIFYANADVLFDHRLPARLKDHAARAALAVVRRVCGSEEVKVCVEADRVTAIGKQLEPERAYGEFIGVARLDAAAAAVLGQMLVRCVEGEKVVTDYFERAVDRMCEHHRITAVDVTDLPCGEIDFPADLQRAREEIAPRLIRPANPPEP